MALAVLLPLLSTAALVYIFIAGQEDTIPAYIVYTLTFYSYTVLVLAFPKLLTGIKEAIHKNRFGNRYMTDVLLRVKISLYSSLLFNLFYAAFRLITGIHYMSFWYGADAIFYIVLSVARFLLVRHVRKDERDTVAEFKKYRFYGVLIFILNAAFVPVVYQIINHGMGYSYPGLLIYAVATYSFYAITISIVNVVRYRKYNNPVYSAQKALSLTKALVAMFALQTAMFRAVDVYIVLERTMNIVFGVLICCAIFAIAVMMVIRANNELQKQKEEISC
jgi:hypothetical protein